MSICRSILFVLMSLALTATPWAEASETNQPIVAGEGLTRTERQTLIGVEIVYAKSNSFRAVFLTGTNAAGRAFHREIFEWDEEALGTWEVDGGQAASSFYSTMDGEIATAGLTEEGLPVVVAVAADTDLQFVGVRKEGVLVPVGAKRFESFFARYFEADEPLRELRQIAAAALPAKAKP